MMMSWGLQRSVGALPRISNMVVTYMKASEAGSMRAASFTPHTSPPRTMMNKTPPGALLLQPGTSSASRVWVSRILTISRPFSSYVLDGWGGGRGGRGAATMGAGSGYAQAAQWPVSRINTIFNIVPQGHKYVVERFGRLHSIHDAGWFLAIPWVDTISYDIDVRERAIDIPSQSAITRDNVSVEVSGNLFVRFVDPEKAAYGAFNPLYSVMQHSQSAMRSAMGEMELDEILHGRARLNALIKGSLQEAAEPWGLEIRRYEITEVTPDTQIRTAMDKQAAAERDRREQVLRAEGEKRRAELQSEGVRISLTNESQGNLIKVQNEAEASKTKILLEAQGQAEALRLTAQAQAEALAVVAQQLQQPGGLEAARWALAREYVTMYGQMGQQSNTILFNDRPADVSALMAQAMLALQAASSSSPPSPSSRNSPLEATRTSSSSNASSPTHSSSGSSSSSLIPSQS